MGRAAAATLERGSQRILRHPREFKIRKQTKGLIRCFENDCAEGTLECGGLTPPWVATMESA